MTTARRERTRRKLIEAALDTVASEGFEAASVDVIARRAGFSVGALYSNFEGKDDLFFAVFDEHVAWFEQRLHEASTAHDRARALQEWMEDVAADPRQFLVFVEFWAYAVRKPETRRHLARRMAAMRSLVTELVGDEQLALLALATVRGLALEQLVDREAVPPEVVAMLSETAITDD